jgi:hypothetical protein
MRLTAIEIIQSLIDRNRNLRKDLEIEGSVLDMVRLKFLEQDRKHHVFDDKDELHMAMLSNFNPYDTFELKDKKSKKSKKGI